MEVTVSQQQGHVPVTVFQVIGSIDAATCEQVQAKIDQAIEAGAHDIVLDLSKAPYMSSVGIRLLNSTFNKLRGNLPQEADEAMKKGLRDGTFKSPHLKLVKPMPRVTEVLKMSGLDMVFEIHPSVSAAVDSF